MEQVEAGNLEAIIVKDMSRLGCDYMKVGQVMEILRQRGVRLIAINDNVDTAKGDSDMTPFLNWFKNLCCLRGGIYKRPSDSTKVLDAAAYCFYSTRPTKR